MKQLMLSQLTNSQNNSFLKQMIWPSFVFENCEQKIIQKLKKINLRKLKRKQ